MYKCDTCMGEGAIRDENYCERRCDSCEGSGFFTNPCPCCDSKTIIIYLAEGQHAVYCKFCSMVLADGFTTAEDAAAWWNSNV